MQMIINGLSPLKEPTLRVLLANPAAVTGEYKVNIFCDLLLNLAYHSTCE
jgi:hypothetical protein